VSQPPTQKRDVWAGLRAFTPARIGIRSVGGALPTTALLELQLDHARAREAVYRELDLDSLEGEIRRVLPVVRVHSAAPDRATYIRLPSLGRQLDTESQERLARLRSAVRWDLTFIIADGLSGPAVMEYAFSTLLACLPRLAHWKLSPTVLAQQARVALGDPICEALASRMSVVLIGERPGLSVSNSLGAYVTWEPRPGRTDAERNCVSNIHAGGLACEDAARSICWILEEAKRRGYSGTALKNETTAPPSISAQEDSPAAGRN
jgi:ethanolamine ammonia-lyase small subunit